MTISRLSRSGEHRPATIPITKLPDIVRKVTDLIVEAAHPDRIVLFGSYARGEQQKDSDLDILVIKDSDLPPRQRTLQIRKKLRGIKFPLDLVVYTPEELEKWKNIPSTLSYNATHEGIVLYGHQE